MPPILYVGICLKEVANCVDESNIGCAYTMRESLCRSQNHSKIYTHRVKYNVTLKYANFAAQYFTIPAIPSTAMIAGTVHWHDLTIRDAGQHLSCSCLTHAIMTRMHSHWCLLCTVVLVHDESLQTTAQIVCIECNPLCNMLLHTHSLLSHQLDVSEARGDSHAFANFTASLDLHQLGLPVHIGRHLGSQLALAGS